MKFLGLFVLIALSAVSIDAEEKKETLVLLDSLATRETHSIFFKSLQGKIPSHPQKANSSKLKIYFYRS